MENDSSSIRINIERALEHDQKRKLSIHIRVDIYIALLFISCIHRFINELCFFFVSGKRYTSAFELHYTYNSLGTYILCDQ